MADLGTAVDFTDLIVFLRRIDGKFESLLNDFRAEDRRIITAIEELKRYQERLETKLDRLVNMFMYRMAKGDDNHLEAFANTQEGVIILKALHCWFTKTAENVEARLDQFSALKASNPAGPSRDVKGKGPLKASHKAYRAKGTGIKLKPIKEEVDEPLPGEASEGKEESMTKGSDDTDPQSPRLPHVGEIHASASDIREVPDTRDKDLNIIRATELVKGLHDPRKRFTHLFSICVMSDAEWKPIEDILARCEELGVEVSLSLVELYIKLFVENKKKEMAKFRGFMSGLKAISEEDRNREVMRWIVLALDVADKELGKKDTTEGREVTQTTVGEGSSQPREADQDRRTPETFALVEDLISQFGSLIIDLNSLMNFNPLSRVMPISEMVKDMDERLKHVERKVDTIRRNTEGLGIKLKYGRFAPLLIGLANSCGLCFERWIYHGKLR